MHGEKYTMRRSKMEMEVDILKILAQKGRLKLTHIMYKTNVNCSVLNTNLEFLIGQGQNRSTQGWKPRLFDYRF